MNRQHGGILSFALVGIVLVGLMIGGLYLSKQQARVARDTTPTGGTITQNDQPYQSAAGDNNDESSPAGESAAPSPAPSPSLSPRPEAVANTGPSETIPASGPTETVFVTIAMAITVFSLVHFLHSRRELSQIALRQ